ncbi:DUF2169 family type VI secretion system accessory protein [Hyalangium versicolor]|uniref:DUF2169 family type VI secretion system accessory protein n=1 Tax=Hyalangium versicolor TaxID=2861190 RepID=UPI001CCDC7FF|nr:DUF2169 domain-containing protein [Hyalangium versicolor]
MELVNRTPFAAERTVVPDREGRDVLLTVVKCTYALGKGGRLEPAPKQLPVQAVDDFYGEPGESSVRWESDLAVYKPATDVVVLGHAYPPRRPEPQVQVALRVGKIFRVLTVFGDRRWRKGLGLSSPEPFAKMPLTYERAFGGTDRSAPDPRHHEMDPRNPVGRGFRAQRTGLPAGEGFLPNIEDPEHLIRSPKDRPPPAGLGFIARSWQPRAALAGTYGEAWRKNRAPLPPEDFDNRHHNAAPAPLIASPFFEGNELVELAHLSPRGTLRFHLPGTRPRVFVGIARERHEVPMRFDTLVLLPDEEQAVMLWRGHRRLTPQDMLQVEHIEVRQQ